ncbi:MAG: ABC transporter ATP-binding protein [Fervidicoccaceae archaeon]
MLVDLFLKRRGKLPEECEEERYFTAEGLLVRRGAFSVKVERFTLDRGEIAVIFGPNGSGKTTLLKAIAGVLEPHSGKLCLNNKILFLKQGNRKKVNVPPEKRNISYMPQSYLLFPHLTVLANVELPLKGKKMSAEEIRKRAEEVLALVGILEKKERYPRELSGGERQRAALARALAPRPELILLDEPFSSIDVEGRDHLRREVRRILEESGSTALIVSHLKEDEEVGDKVIRANSSVFSEDPTSKR